MLGYYNKLSSEVYDHDKSIGHSFGDIEFYSERLASCQGKILEPCVGTGRVLIPLLEKGLHVDGFDMSTEMLNICRTHCEQRGLQANVFEEKMESFSLNEKYEAIILPTGSFLLLHKREDSIKALRNFRHHLSDKGRLIIDIFLQTDLTTNNATTKTWQLNKNDTITLESKVLEVDYINQHTMSHNRYEKWRGGQLIQTELEQFYLRWYGVEEFKSILEQIGFEDIVVSADYKYGQYPDSPDQTITFEAVVNKK